MSRVKIVDTLGYAKKTRKVFTKKNPREMREYPFTWPTRYQHVGDSLAVAYASDKWKDDGDFELYKHLAESRNRALCVPGLLPNLLTTRGRMSKHPVYGPMVDFDGVYMPRHVAILGYFEEADLQLHIDKDERGRGVLGKGDEGCVQVLLEHAMLAGGVLGKEERPFLVVYSEPRSGSRGGVHMIIVGEELDIEADGIVG